MGDAATHSSWDETRVRAAEVETLFVVDIDLAQVADAHARFPALKSRRGNYQGGG